MLAVTDTGSGMDEITLSHLFEPFFTTKERGMGLGLAIVEHTMRGHGGFVRVTSEPNLGSTFTLHFPIPNENAFEPTLAESIR
jgi:signal transduction histidine kinase